MLQLSATRCSCIAILLISLVSFVAITLCVAFQRAFVVVVIVYFVMTQSGNFWIHLRKSSSSLHFLNMIHLRLMAQQGEGKYTV
jgi:hypothetical protein